MTLRKRLDGEFENTTLNSSPLQLKRGMNPLPVACLSADRADRRFWAGERGV
jgi:hypothetical protein